MIELEHKYCQQGSDMQIKDGTVICGYASLFGQPDQGGDIVGTGAYAASLGQKRSIRMLWQHDPTQPIGVWDEVREDATGLWVKGRILTDVAKGREAAALIEAGAIDGLSIGYRTVKAHKDASGQRHLDQLDLWEVSLVTFPMLAQARVGGSKAAEGADAPVAAHAVTAVDKTLRDLAAVFDAARQALATP